MNTMSSGTVAVFRRILFLLPLMLLCVSSTLAQDDTRRIQCSVTGPDSVHFDKTEFNRYIPGTFPIEVEVVHQGSVAIDSVVAFPRSNQRFTVIPPASILLTPRLEPGASQRTTFSLRVNPRDESGYDTVTVAISGKEGARTECQCIIWVEKEYRPMNEVICPGSGSIPIVFVDTLNRYVPTPIRIPVSVINHGDAPSKDTRLFYVATPEVSPVLGQQLILDLGTIAPGARVDRVFELEAIPRDDDITVSLPFKAQGRGGLGDRLIDTLCAFDLSIPPVREVLFELQCESDPHIRFEDGHYIPNPFAWNVRIRNTGSSRAKNVRAVISLPVAYVLEGGSNELFIGDMAAGEERQVSWTVRARAVLAEDTSEICVRAFDEFNRMATCCDSLILPAMRNPELEATCLVLPDSIHVDSQTGLYRPAEFTLTADLRNIGTDVADSLQAEIIIADPDIRFIDPPGARQDVTAQLSPGGVAQVQWRLAPLAVSVPRDLAIRVRFTSRNSETVFTTCPVHIAASLAPALDCEASTIPDDTLHFNTATLEHDALLFTATLTNRGSIAARDLQATVLLPPAIGIPAEEAAVKYLGSPLGVDSTWRVTWRLQPVKKREGSLDTIRVEFRSGVHSAYCGDWIFVIGIPPVTVFTIPRNIVERYNREFTVPILIDESENKDISEIALTVEYDERHIEFLAWETSETLLGQGWTLDTGGEEGRVFFLARNDTARLQGIGELIRMRYRVRFGDGDDILRYASSPLEFDSLASSVNRGSILARFYNGDVIVSGDCLYPLAATRKYIVLKNAPNPFNPSTHLRLALPLRAHVSLSVFDMLGREITSLHDGMLYAGDHEFSFDGSGLTSGSYLAMLRIDGTPVALRRMMLLR
ncbi:MAG: hypothetical protein RBU27_02725 [Bacteroidota bacterium]|jgi:hypothetical protein|nr:hypothetical protein [Bacteroidota bacterium]